LILSIASIALAAKFISDEQIIARLNARPNASWKAVAQFPNMTSETAKRMLGFEPDQKIRDNSQIIKEKTSPRVSVPSSFDARTQWPGCVHPVRNQGQCGSCWAFGATESVEDRFCVFSNGSQNFTLSVEQLVSCNLFGMEGCNGGEPVSALTYISEWGLPLDSCVPYTAGDGTAPDCASDCEDGETYASHYTIESSMRWHESVEGIQAALMDGPVEACFDVYEDFFNYAGGVYVYDGQSDLAGGHCIEMIGWGHDSTSNLDYWICKNSWDVTWGNEGFFLIERGVNMCGIEDEVFSITPFL